MVREPTHSSFFDRRVLIDIILTLIIVSLLQKIEQRWLFVLEKAWPGLRVAYLVTLGTIAELA